MNPFTARNLRESRLLWNPVVHRFIGSESCYFLFVRLRNPSRKVYHQIESLLADAKIVGYCFYYILGYYDILTRFWAKEHKYEQLKDELNQLKDIIEQADVFRVSDIDYLWVDQRNLGPDDVMRNKEAILKMATGDRMVETSLRKEGLIFNVPAIPDSGVKFYVWLTRAPGTHVYKFESRDLKTFLKEQAEEGLINTPTVYTGIGVTYMVKAVVDSFAKIMTFSELLTEKASEFGFRTMTSLIVNADALESDDIDSEELSTPLIHLQIKLRREVQDVASKISRLKSEESQSLINISSRYNFVGTQFENVFKALFKGYLEKDGFIILDNLTFLFRFERLLRDFAKDSFEKVFKQDWFQKVKKAALDTEVPRAGELQWKRYALLDVITVMGKIASENETLQKDFANMLGQTWDSTIRKVTELRNDYVHAKIDPSDITDLNIWTKNAEIVCEVGKIYLALLHTAPGERR